MNVRISSAICPACGSIVDQLAAGRLATHLDSAAGAWCAKGYRSAWLVALTARARRLWERGANA